jgi:serine/threonine protein kinase
VECRCIARFVEFFEEGQELWLVFRHEGISLRDWMYSRTADANTKVVSFAPSSGWYDLKDDSRPELDPSAMQQPPTQHHVHGNNQNRRNNENNAQQKQKREHDSIHNDNGNNNENDINEWDPKRARLLRDMFYQILVGVAVAHRSNITHRDIKPSNILIQLPEIPSSNDANSNGATDTGAAFTKENGSLSGNANSHGNDDSQTIDRLHPFMDHFPPSFDDLHQCDLNTNINTNNNNNNEMMEAVVTIVTTPSMDIPPLEFEPPLTGPSVDTGAQTPSSRGRHARQQHSSSSSSSGGKGTGYPRRSPVSSIGYIRFCDFGSSVDDDTAYTLYPPSTGPTKDEATLDYAPPEGDIYVY